MGTPEFAVASLDALVKAGCNIVGVITAPDKAAGRGLQLQQSAVKKYAVEKGIPVILTSRCPAGETDYIYSYPGAGKHLHDLGVIFSDYLNGQKARIKMMIVLGLTKRQSEIRKYFE